MPSSPSRLATWPAVWGIRPAPVSVVQEPSGGMAPYLETLTVVALSGDGSAVSHRDADVAAVEHHRTTRWACIGMDSAVGCLPAVVIVGAGELGPCAVGHFRESLAVAGPGSIELVAPAGVWRIQLSQCPVGGLLLT